MNHPVQVQPRTPHIPTKLSKLLLFAVGVTATVSTRADLGLPREAYGVWDREGLHSITDYPYARGQSIDLSWAAVHTARSTFDWSDLDLQVDHAYGQNQFVCLKVSPIDGSAPGHSMPTWIFGAPTATEGGVPRVTESGTGAAEFVYGYYLSPQFKVYFEEMVKAFAKKIRIDLAPSRQAKVAFVRVDTGATGDESAYENPALIPSQYQISQADWENYRLWVFEVYRKAFQEGPGPVIPLLFVHTEPESYPVAWSWVSQNMPNGFGVKFDGATRGHHLTDSEMTPKQFKPLAVDSNLKLFSRSEMDQTWTKPYFQLNVPLGMYWCAVEQLNAGMAIWDWSGTCMEGASANRFKSTADFFNTWAAELQPATARGGFCIFHEGLDASDTVKFPDNYNGSGPAQRGNQARYQAICKTYAAQGAKMDDLAAATWLQVMQRDQQAGYNDAGWGIHPGNYDRFLTQINPDATSKGLWRVNGPLTATSHPYDRVARRFDVASGRNAMYFNINDKLITKVGQKVQINVVYLDRGVGKFGICYDASRNTQKRALTVTKTNTNTWKTATVTVTDWVFGNRGPMGADISLLNLDKDDDIFHRIEVVKVP